ncbi:hypothetical protein O6H91_10G007800 [Diphasiastrum complanatum]|nr:hypothetical protein O6H91_10G007800 [Diphasiastrum complanatum]
MILYKPDISHGTFESLKPLFRIGKEIIKWKYIVFLFNTPDLKDEVSALWPSRVSLRSIKRMLEHLEDCEFKRVKVRKDGMTVYLYAVKRSNEEFVLQNEWNRLLCFIRAREEIF